MWITTRLPPRPSADPAPFGGSSRSDVSGMTNRTHCTCWTSRWVQSCASNPRLCNFHDDTALGSRRSPATGQATHVQVVLGENVLSFSPQDLYPPPDYNQDYGVCSPPPLADRRRAVPSALAHAPSPRYPVSAAARTSATVVSGGSVSCSSSCSAPRAVCVFERNSGDTNLEIYVARVPEGADARAFNSELNARSR
jgi:hypothetical protein